MNRDPLACSLEDQVRSWLPNADRALVDLGLQIVGRDAIVDGPFGPRALLYADHAASGRAFWPIERFLLEQVLPYYANPHTHASYCGEIINRLRAEARAAIARCFGVPDSHAVIFTGSGATAGLNKLARLLVPAQSPGERPLVLLGPYEHHSNILPWRESAAETFELDEDPNGGPDLAQLERILQAQRAERRVIGAFSAASNVTGLLTPVGAVTAILKTYGALSIWDYAGGAPYLPIDVAAHGMDAIVVSPHKFIGGPGASGLLVMRRSLADGSVPSLPGGGTVSFVSPWAHSYSGDLVAREEAGTPNVTGDLRAALAILLKARIGDRRIADREAGLNARALDAWAAHDRIQLLGRTAAPRIPIFSFRIADGAGGTVHHQLVTRLLSDVHGVQARGGCACAGPYAHQLLGIDQPASAGLLQRLESGQELDKPGWTRVNFSYAMTDEDADRLIGAVLDIAERASELARYYGCDTATARFAFEGTA